MKSFLKEKRGLFAVWGEEAEQFLNGLVTNDVKALADGGWMYAAFPNAQGRLLAVARFLRQGGKFFIETEEATREKVFQNLFRFTFAGDFFAEDLSDRYSFYSIFGGADLSAVEGILDFGGGIFVPAEREAKFLESLAGLNELSAEEYEITRIEMGIPLYGIDMDENTIVPEIGLPDMISYQKGCYIGQEIIARIHFRGHVAKQLRGLVSDSGSLEAGAELASIEGKNAGRITSACYSPRLEKQIALGYVRYEFLSEGTGLKAGEVSVSIKNLPFFKLK